ncbi:hypothetical protein HUJ04_011332 [Dendroctonus ponderosae]|nr:hypothetical protein HUJ04_011332 [Dendroctonus ponderosae]
MSSDPSDPQPLTPAHFLIGERLTNLPDKDYCQIPENRLSRFQRLQQITQGFWARWSKEYVAELQQRTKWKKNALNLLSPGSLVLIKEDGLPPLKWMMGVVQEVHPGADGVIRTATIKTASSTLKRPVTKLSSSTWGAQATTLPTAAISLVYATAEYCAPGWQGSRNVNKVLSSEGRDVLNLTPSGRARKICRCMLYKWGLVEFRSCDCDAPEQTRDLIKQECSISKYDGPTEDIIKASSAA